MYSISTNSDLALIRTPRVEKNVSTNRSTTQNSELRINEQTTKEKKHSSAMKL